jgi:hypothetical protein
MTSNNLLLPLLVGQGKLFQQYPVTTMMLCPCTDNCKVTTLHATTKSIITCNEHLSSVEHCMQIMNEGFGQAHHADASTSVHCQTVEHTAAMCECVCPKWSAKYASSTLELSSCDHFRMDFCAQRCVRNDVQRASRRFTPYGCSAMTSPQETCVSPCTFRAL